MRWTLGLLLLAGAGCGASQTKMVACPETGCPDSYAKVSPEGTRYTPPPAVQPAPMESTMPPAPPAAPLPDNTPPAPEPPVPSP
jgi:hypothetical protein